MVAARHRVCAGDHDFRLGSELEYLANGTVSLPDERHAYFDDVQMCRPAILSAAKALTDEVNSQLGTSEFGSPFCSLPSFHSSMRTQSLQTMRVLASPYKFRDMRIGGTLLFRAHESALAFGARRS